MVIKPSLQSILEDHRENLTSWSFTSWHLRTLYAIKSCRTVSLGGHIDVCSFCKKLHISYNSCRNRHCPKCQGHKQAKWITARENELLNTPYYHLVFTLPSELNEVALRYSKEVYRSLFKASWDTLSLFGEKELGVKMGMIAVLHTWGQNLSLHPHLHCIVPSGGVDTSGHWKSNKKRRKFLFPVKGMSKVFRAKMVAELRKNKLPISQKQYDTLFSKNWVVYAKKAFGKPEYVVAYLGRYTHKIAISDHRIQRYDKQTNQVYFTAKNYRKGGKKEVLCLTAKDFIIRFQLHILPKGFTRIRHYGILSSSWKKEKLPKLQASLQSIPIVIKQQKKQEVHLRCTHCKKGRLITICTFDSRGPPRQYKHLENIEDRYQK